VGRPQIEAFATSALAFGEALSLEAFGIAAVAQFVRSVLNLELSLDPSGRCHLQVVRGAFWEELSGRADAGASFVTCLLSL
jgi:hypothetical protein